MIAFDGERYLPELTWPQLSYEHWHRYLWVRDLAHGLRVLDAACGEGYGSAVLAETAAEVVGVDVAEAVIAHAQQTYQQENLRFTAAPVEALPLADAYFDLIVSFETIEHLDAATQAAMLREFRRLLRPGGLLVISTPDRQSYRVGEEPANPFHRHELSADEFTIGLSAQFRHVQLFGQRVFPASYIWPLERAAAGLREYTLAMRDGRFSEVDRRAKPVLYLLAICSDRPTAAETSLLIDVSDQAIRQAEDAAAIARSQLEVETRCSALLAADRERALRALTELEAHLLEKNAALLYLDALRRGEAAEGEQPAVAVQLQEQLQLMVAQAQREREELLAERAAVQRDAAELATAVVAAEQQLAALAEDNRQLRALQQQANTAGRSAPVPLGQRLGVLWRRLRDAPRRLTRQGLIQRHLIGLWRVLGDRAGCLLFVDMPQPDELQSGMLTVRGWAFALDGPVAQITIRLDGRLVGRAHSGRWRPDVYHAFAFCPTSAVGYELDIAVPYEGVARLSVDAVDVYGGSRRIERLVRLSPAAEGQAEPQAALLQPPPAADAAADAAQLRVEIEQLRWRNGEFALRGWAAWPVDAPTVTVTVTVTVLVDGEPLLQLRADRSRPDRAAAAGEPLRAAGFAGRAELVGDAAEQRTIQLITRLGDIVDQRDLIVVHEAQRDGLTMKAADDLRYLVSAYEQRYETPPMILWLSAADTAGLPADVRWFAPPQRGLSLPYLDATIDAVLVDAADTALVVEARRVVRHLLILRAPQSGGLQAEWTVSGSRELPLVSIIVAMFNEIEHTAACLTALTATIDEQLNYEVLVVDDASTEDTGPLRAAWAADRRVQFLRNDDNGGFLISSNRGAAAARGELLVFLNNDTLPQPGWLRALVRVLLEQPDVGAVGGKLIYPDGRLQEAGSFVFRDGSAWNFGKRDERADAPLYVSLRDVDYCSGALLATRRNLFTEIGGFDLRYAPAYYEDVDYCFAARERGWRTVYQPEALVIHHEGVSSGTDERIGVKRYQVINQQKFVEKWQVQLTQHAARPYGADDPLLASLALGLAGRQVRHEA